MSKSLFAITFLLLNGLSIFGQTSKTLKGTVLSKEGSYKLIGAKVFFSDTNQGTTADIDGKFELNSTRPFPWHLKVEYIGYLEKSFTVTDSDSLQLIKMEEDPKANDKVIILPEKRKIPPNPTASKNCWKRSYQ